MMMFKGKINFTSELNVCSSKTNKISPERNYHSKNSSRVFIFQITTRLQSFCFLVQHSSRHENEVTCNYDNEHRDGFTLGKRKVEHIPSGGGVSVRNLELILASDPGSICVPSQERWVNAHGMARRWAPTGKFKGPHLTPIREATHANNSTTWINWRETDDSAKMVEPVCGQQSWAAWPRCTSQWTVWVSRCHLHGHLLYWKKAAVGRGSRHQARGRSVFYRMRRKSLGVNEQRWLCFLGMEETLPESLWKTLLPGGCAPHLAINYILLCHRAWLIIATALTFVVAFKFSSWVLTSPLPLGCRLLWWQGCAPTFRPLWHLPCTFAAVGFRQVFLIYDFSIMDAFRLAYVWSN